MTGDTPIERLYTASLYYLGKDVRSWEIHLVVTLDDEPLVTVSLILAPAVLTMVKSHQIASLMIYFMSLGAAFFCHWHNL